MKKRINIIANDITVDIEKLKEIITNEWQSGELYDHFYNQGFRGETLFHLILSDLSDFADGLSYQTKCEAQKKLNLPNAVLDYFYDNYPKPDVRSIGFEVLLLLERGPSGAIEELTTDDIPMILEFLDTPPEKSLEAWDRWEKYWANLDYAARRKKLLEIKEDK